MLTEMKKADRETMAEMVEDLCRSKGATAQRRDPQDHGPKEVVIDIVLGEARVSIDFDGSKGIAEGRDVYCMAWNSVIEGRTSRARMTDAFGMAVGASVNPHHRAKCMGFADGIDELLNRLGKALDCIQEGRAFERNDRIAA